MAEATGFKLLRIFSMTFKVLAWLTLILMLVGIVGLLVGASSDQNAFTLPVVFNMIFSGLLGFLGMYSFGEIIRVLLKIEANTRGPETSA